MERPGALIPLSYGLSIAVVLVWEQDRGTVILSNFKINILDGKIVIQSKIRIMMRHYRCWVLKGRIKARIF